MSKTGKKHLITSALPYANGPLHIGHIAGAYLPADIYVRYLKLTGEDAVFICGSDEHGAAITMRALKENTTPQEIVDKYHSLISKTFEEFGINFDFYHRTSGEDHHQTAQEFFTVLNEKNAFEKREKEQFYDVKHRQFLADRYIKGTCPKCGHTDAYGDQCEKCGASLNPTELIDPVSVLSGKTPELRKTTHWFLPMQRHENWLRDWVKEGTLNGELHHDPAVWRNQVVGQCLSWIDGGLGPRAMTRDLNWGVPVPVKNAEGKVLYVWMDAPIGYISATKAWAKLNGKNHLDYWSGENAELTHFIAKDNIVFHCIIFPILLKEHGGYNLPVNVPANEFLNLEGDKISTSREWAVWLHEYLNDFPGKQDELRYVLTSISPESRDSEFTWKDFQARINNELVAILGNFINRALVLTHKYFDGKVPEAGEPEQIDRDLHKEILQINQKPGELIKQHRYREALKEVMNIARAGNKYLADTEPWKVYKTNPDRVKTILNHAIQVAGHLSLLSEPFLPFTAKKLRAFLNLEIVNWDLTNNFDLIVSGQPIDKPALLFEKITDEQVNEQVEKLKTKKEQQKKEKEMNAMPDIEFDDFTKLDLRVVEILEAEAVPKAKKLLKLTVDTGVEKRTVVSGIAQHYKPENIVGKKAVYLANLKPKSIFGIESHGMLLMAGGENGELSFMSPEKNSIAPGDKIS